MTSSKLRFVLRKEPAKPSKTVSQVIKSSLERVKEISEGPKYQDIAIKSNYGGYELVRRRVDD